MKTLLDIESALWRELDFANNQEDKKATFDNQQLYLMASIVFSANIKANKVRRCFDLLMQFQALANEILQEEIQKK